MDKKKIIAVMLLVAAGIAAWYYFIRGKGGAAGAAIASNPGLGAADTAAYNQMISIFKAEADPDALHWLLPYVQQTLNGTNANPLDLNLYGVNGKVSKAGAFIGEYARAYHINGTFLGKKPPAGYSEVSDRNGAKPVMSSDAAAYEAARKQVNDKLYAIWYNFQSNYLQQAIAAA